MKPLKTLILFLALSFNITEAKQSNQINETSKEIYGDHTSNLTIKISNGGAGPTGILKALAEDYLSINKERKIAIAWYQNISSLSLNLLKENKVDIALIYEPVDAKKAITQNLASNYSLIFNDHFLIVGPEKNEADILPTDSASKAFAKIAQYGKKNPDEKKFLTRDDSSGTNIKEKLLWTLIHQAPFDENNQWYFKYQKFPSDALLKADQEGMYTITDWGTWISNKHTIKNTKILVRGGEDLVNPCLALLQKNPTPETLHFLEYLKSSKAQELIAKYGQEKPQKKAFFTPANQLDFEN
ncbi:substrate-binding domain-containing protein [Iodobacter fluviatilis]|uniref:PBP domain-containing protein n=1 Tax=Iodobacter fluviatilis TaxID=537 RepID=A0A7G3G9R4_9NEIS|nr:hypothetical protein [Iodobacter fluviatilis]QBC43904.1 hypothetical protein C1H71_10330 [Iodobacter fluviatilis]